MIIVIGSVITTPETHEEMQRLSVEHCARSRTEPGCIAHNVYTDCEAPNKLVFVEYWADLAALKAHFHVPESKEFVEKLSAMSPDAPDMQIYAAESQMPG